MEVAPLSFGAGVPWEKSYELTLVIIGSIWNLVYLVWYLWIWHPFEQVSDPDTDGEAN